MPTADTALFSLAYVNGGAAFASLMVCWVGAGLLARRPRLALHASFMGLLAWLVMGPLAETPAAGLAVPVAATRGLLVSPLASWLASAAVFAGLVAFAWVNSKLAESKTPREEGALAPRCLGHLFSGLLCLSLLAQLPGALGRADLQGALFALALTGLAVSALQIKWRVSGGLLGFSDLHFALGYLVCMAYQALFLLPPGAGTLALVLLLAAYVPLSRAGHTWTAHRGYSVGIFLCLERAWGLDDGFFAAPPALEAAWSAVRASVLNELLLLAVLASVVLLVVCRFNEWRYDRLAARASGARRLARPDPQLQLF